MSKDTPKLLTKVVSAQEDIETYLNIIPTIVALQFNVQIAENEYSKAVKTVALHKLRPVLSKKTPYLALENTPWLSVRRRIAWTSVVPMDLSGLSVESVATSSAVKDAGVLLSCDLDRVATMVRESVPEGQEISLLTSVGSRIFQVGKNLYSFEFNLQWVQGDGK